jgi:AcrR family transcriptional regulator
MAEKLDRRVQRTRALLRDALLTLIVEKGYDELRVEDITERANLRRATFYLHYKDKDDLLFTVLTDTFDTLAEHVSAQAQGDVIAGKTKLAAFLPTFQHAEQYHTLYRILLSGQVGAGVARRIRDYLASLLERSLTESGETLRVPVPVLAQAIAGVELALIQWWLEQDRPYSVEQMAAYTHRIALEGLLGAFDRDDVRNALHAQIDPPL